MNQLSTEDRCRVLACLVEGNSIRATVWRMKIKCEMCGHETEVNPAALLGSAGGSVTSKRKANAARANAKKGGWPKGRKRGKRPADANALAHQVVQEAIMRTEEAPARKPKGRPSRRGSKRGQQGQPPLPE